MSQGPTGPVIASVIPAVTAPRAYDPITLEVMRNALYSIADEMNASLVRASYSTNVKDRRDCSCALYKTTGEVVAMSGYTPLHMGTMHSCLVTALQAFPAESLRPGDTVILNTPYPAGPGHLNDVCVIAPIFVDGDVFAFAASQAHRVDVGGFAPGSMPFGVTEIYQEGLQITPIKIASGGVLDEALLAFINANLRAPRENRGDLLAQIAANNVAQRRLEELTNKYGADIVRAYLEAMLDYTERRMSAGLRAIPRGTYKAEDVIEGDGIDDGLITLRVSVEVDDGRITTDFEASDAQVAGPLNCRWPSVAACVFYVLKCLVDPDLPANAGAFRPITILTKPGTILEAAYPAAVCNANIVTTQRIVDVLIRALLPALPERTQAASSGTMNLLNIGGIDPILGSQFSYIETFGGGQGAMWDHDGADAVQNHMTNTRNAPVEVIEGTYPLRVNRYALVPNSEGAGEFRGGLGLIREMEILSDSARLTLSSDRRSMTPWGVDGGLNAAGSVAYVVASDGSTRALPSKVTTTLRRGDRICTITPGGGGWGDPKQRDRGAVRRDLRNGLLSRDRAREVYRLDCLEEEEEERMGDQLGNNSRVKKGRPE